MTGVEEDIRRFLAEDIGPGDITSDVLLGDQAGVAWIEAREEGILAGLGEAAATFRLLGCRVEALRAEGELVRPGDRVLEVRGSAKAILAGERLALNLLMRMGGIASATRRLLERAREANPRIRVAATRKTAPGLRTFDKRAVEVGGGEAHRYGLYDAILIKDNHLRFVPLEDAVRRAAATGRNVEVEVESPEAALRAAEAGAHVVLLDNLTAEEAGRAWGLLRSRFPGVLIEVSGGIDEDNGPTYASYADILSSGALTHSVRALDFALEAKPG
jgi:nicotinate-nucleotide pyrophosphorylase (carboxylating)